MEEFVTEFVNLQCYVPYLRVEKIKVYNFISCLPLVYKKKIVFEILQQCMKKLERPNCATICLNKYPNWVEVGKIKKIENIDQRRKGFKPSLFGKGTRGHTDKNYNKWGSTNINGVNSIKTSSGGWNSNPQACCMKLLLWMT